MWTVKNAFYTFIVIILTFLSCSKGPNEGIPAYVKVDQVDLVTKIGEGSDAHLINSLWLESEGEFIGVFEMPVEAPALVNGTKQIIVNAGVFVKGDFFNREIYPMYRPFITDLNFVPGETINLTPVFEYHDEVEFPLNEDFESGNVFSGLNRTSLGDVNNIEGRALHIALDAATPLVRGTTSTPVAIPEGKRVYIEMQFKGNVDFALGIETLSNGNVTQSGYLDRFFATDEWYKIYYDITFLLNDLNATSFNFFIEALKLESEVSSDLYIDNFKIVMI